MTETIDAPVALSDAIGDYVTATRAAAGTFQLAGVAAGSDEWYTRAASLETLEALLESGKELREAGKFLCDQVNAYAVKHNLETNGGV